MFLKPLAFVVFLFFCFAANCQVEKPVTNPYTYGIGVGYNPTLKYPYIVSAKMYMKRGYSLEAIGYNVEESFKVAFLFCPYLNLGNIKNFRILAGPGIHAGIWKNKYKNNSFEKNPILGVDAIAGLELKIPKVPIALQVHYQPSIDFIGNTEMFDLGDRVGAVIRFVF